MSLKIVKLTLIQIFELWDFWAEKSPIVCVSCLNFRHKTQVFWNPPPQWAKIKVRSYANDDTHYCED